MTDESRPVARDGVPAPDDVREHVDELDAPAAEKLRAEAAEAAANRRGERADEPEDGSEDAAEDVAEASHPAPEPPD